MLMFVTDSSAKIEMILRSINLHSIGYDLVDVVLSKSLLNLMSMNLRREHSSICLPSSHFFLCYWMYARNIGSGGK